MATSARMCVAIPATLRTRHSVHGIGERSADPAHYEVQILDENTSVIDLTAGSYLAELVDEARLSEGLADAVQRALRAVAEGQASVIVPITESPDRLRQYAGHKPVRSTRTCSRSARSPGSADLCVNEPTRSS